MWDLITAEFLRPPALAWPVLVLRLVGAAVLCGLIGFEREVQQRPAGLRTHMLVGLAAAVYCILMLDLVAWSEANPQALNADPLRLIEAVTSGVAFLAAGMVVFSRGKVQGLTTGAGMWLAASVGLACGLGLWLIAAVSTGLALVIMRSVKINEKVGELTSGDADGK